MTVVARTLLSIPERTANETWERVLDLVAPNGRSNARRELESVAGVACSCIADEALAEDPIVVRGVGPRLRIYALYGDDALDGEGASESPLSWVPTDGDWQMSIPCLKDDLVWVSAKLAKSSGRVTARALGDIVDDDEENDRVERAPRNGERSVDLDVFFRR